MIIRKVVRGLERGNKKCLETLIEGLLSITIVSTNLCHRPGYGRGDTQHSGSELSGHTAQIFHPVPQVKGLGSNSRKSFLERMSEVEGHSI